MNRHLTDRRPKPSRLFAWSRVAHKGGVQYRLFRRDGNGALHIAYVPVHLGQDLCITARDLCIAKRKLRELVDEIDLAAMGVTA